MITNCFVLFFFLPKVSFIQGAFKNYQGLFKNIQQFFNFQGLFKAMRTMVKKSRL